MKQIQVAVYRTRSNLSLLKAPYLGGLGIRIPYWAFWEVNLD